MKLSSILGIALALTASYTTAAAADPVAWGVNGHPWVAYPNVSIQQQLDLVKQLGATSYRISVGSDTASMDRLAAALPEAKTRGITILPVLVGSLTKTKTPADLYKDNYAMALAFGKRFKGQFKAIELGNELENYAIIQPCEMREDGSKYPCNWGPGSGDQPSDYYLPRWKQVSAVLKGLSDGMIAADPNVSKAMGTAGWGHFGAFHRMLVDGVKWDITVWHWYGDDANLKYYLPWLTYYHKPIWITEFNTSGGNKGTAAGDAAQATDLVARMNTIRKLAPAYNVQAAFVYELLDEPYWSGGESTMGLVSQVKVNNQWTVSKVHSAYTAAQKNISQNKVITN